MIDESLNSFKRFVWRREISGYDIVCVKRSVESTTHRAFPPLVYQPQMPLVVGENVQLPNALRQSNV